MDDAAKEKRDKIRRSISAEFVRMEDDFDETRDMRKRIVNQIMADAASVKLVDDTGAIKEDAELGMKIMTTALKALSEVERASSTAISLKLKNQEQAIASAAATKERIQIVLRATKAGAIEENDHFEDNVEAELSRMFDGDIKDHELKSNPNDISD